MNSWRIVLWGSLLCIGLRMSAQSNIRFTVPEMDSILRGHYDPSLYASSQPVIAPDVIAAGLVSRISADSLRGYLEALTSFENRNTGADTVSNVRGVGAARRWAEGAFAAIGQQNEGRLLSGYLEFDRMICSMGRHRNPVALLPGSDSSAHGFVLIEAHMDSRCAGVCDIGCDAQGAEDNASGCALVMEMARVMSAYTFRRSILFMLTIGEEQGLYGAEALADYCTQQSLPVYAVQNNDVVGGIYCGQTASPPGCTGAGEVDSINVRLFSAGGFNSPHKQLVRFMKLEYKEMVMPLINIPLSLKLMSAEDRTGRGGDHIPFRQQGFTAMRVTCANEHGDGSPGPGYVDRQHTTADSLGWDLDHDGDLDTFFVDFRYLARNTVMNANAASMAALGPERPTFIATGVGNGVEIRILSQTQYGVYRVALRTTGIEWDSVYTMQGLVDTLYGLPTGVPLIFSTASVDGAGTESLFSNEQNLILVGMDTEQPVDEGPQLLPNRPNPFDEYTIIAVHRPSHVVFESASIRITDQGGKLVQEIPITLEADLNEVLFHHGFHAAGVYYYSLVIDGRVVQTRRMVMAGE